MYVCVFVHWRVNVCMCVRACAHPCGSWRSMSTDFLHSSLVFWREGILLNVEFIPWAGLAYSLAPGILHGSAFQCQGNSWVPLQVLGI